MGRSKARRSASAGGGRAAAARLTPVEARMAAAAAQSRADWADRHPAAARAEAAMANASRAIARASTVHPATPETRAKARRVRQGAVARLFRSGALSAAQLGAAMELTSAHEAITGEVRVRTASMEAQVDGGRRDGALIEALGRVRREVAYSAWRRAVGAGAPRVLSIVVDDVAVTTVAARARIDRRTMVRDLSDALDTWSRCMAEACRDVDAAALIAAQAGL